MSAKIDYYEFLGLKRQCGASDIKRAYRKAALKYHPDHNPDDSDAETNFKLASEAYEVLSDPQKRQHYDQFGHAGLDGMGHHGFNNVDDIFSSFGDIFEDFFGFTSSRRPRTRVRRGDDLSCEVTLTFLEACFGCEKQVDLVKQVSCEKCKGRGHEKDTGRTQCPECHGAGQVRRNQGFFMISTACNICQGEGSIVKDPCRTCMSTGRVRSKKKLKIKVPAGVDQGTRLVLRGEGEAGIAGGPAGDLYTIFRIQPHEMFKRHGNDIHAPLSISFVQAALGDQIEVETLEGVEEVVIPKGVETGETIILEREGIPILQSKRRGNLIYTLFVKTPQNLTDKQEELLEEFGLQTKAPPSKKPMKKAKKKGLFS
jgi:molecular chaperone DnaJ